ncbi:hypothetical protein V8C44DRAFT_327968 [Trichoderma aethiopicum]
MGKRPSTGSSSRSALGHISTCVYVPLTTRSVSQRRRKGSPALIPTPWAEEDEKKKRSGPTRLGSKRPQRDLAERMLNGRDAPRMVGWCFAVLPCQSLSVCNDTCSKPRSVCFEPS